MNRDELICRLASLPFDKREYWVVAGGAMVLHGLRGETQDVDLGCTKALADALEGQGFPTKILADGTRRIEFAKDVEIFEEWLYDRVVSVDGIPVISLEGLLEMKRSLGREKDLADIRAIEEHIRIQQEEKR